VPVSTSLCKNQELQIYQDSPFFLFSLEPRSTVPLQSLERFPPVLGNSENSAWIDIKDIPFASIRAANLSGFTKSPALVRAKTTGQLQWLHKPPFLLLSTENSISVEADGASFLLASTWPRTYIVRSDYFTILQAL
jgi:hypothetical protein